LRFPAFLLLPAVWALNAAAEGLTEEMFLADLPLVLTASRIATSPLGAAAPVSVIDRETIRVRPLINEGWLLAIGLRRGEDWVGSSLDPATEPFRARKRRQHSLRSAWHKHYAPG